MKLSVIIVNYNVKYYIHQCLLSVMKATEGVDTEIFVVDNHSKDGSVEYLRGLFKKINVVSSNQNLGFARANNVAIRRATGDYLLLLNPDTIVGENTIRESIDFMDSHPQAGALGVRMLHTDGTNAPESRRGLPTPMTAFYKMVGLCSRYPTNKRFGHYYMGYLPWDEASEIEVISGAYFFARKTAVDQIGMLDKDFFMYGEDIDLSYRMLKGGWQNWYIPSVILHYKGESTQKSSFKYVHVFYDAMLIFFRKHYGHLAFWISIPVKTAVYFKAFFALIKMQSLRVKKALGFFSPKRSHDLEYLFIGSRKALNKCRQLANDKGLTMDFFEGNNNTLPNGHLDLLDHISLDTQTYIVYDTNAYTYDEIFSIFAREPHPNVLIGTYSINTNMIITDEEVLL